MDIVAAIAASAIVVGLAAALIARRATMSSVARAIGARPDADPITEHHRLIGDAELRVEEAQAHSELLQRSLDALTSGVVVADLSGQVLIQNDLATGIASRPHEQSLVNAAVTDLLKHAANGSSVERDVEIFGPPPRTISLHAVPVIEASRVIAGLAVIEDVTERHRIEKTRRDFVANLSHELRTPVGAASLLGEMLVDEDDAAVRQQLTDRLLIETDRMSATIDDLLELSRIESTEQFYDEVLEVQPLVDETLARTRVAAETKSVRIAAVLPAEPIVMMGNRDQLLTALVNLVENAIKYSSPEDSVSVRARVDEGVVQLVVQDTGRGIPARDLDRIFERFYRVDRSRDSHTGGTGIGLSIVRHVVLNHGGTVEVSSYEGDGSTFTMRVPLVAPAEVSELAPTHKVN